jgi:hypothetical protein
MSWGQRLALATSCGMFAWFIATGGEAMSTIEQLAASLPI